MGESSSTNEEPYMDHKFTTVQLAKPSLPPSKAFPAEVREFLTQLLVVTRNLDTAQAEAIASQWKLGRGDDLWYYDKDMFRHLFGVEGGWALHSEVDLLVRSQRGPSKEKNVNVSEEEMLQYVVLVFCITLALGLSLCAINRWCYTHEAIKLFGIVFVGTPAIVLPIAVLCYFAPAPPDRT